MGLFFVKFYRKVLNKGKCEISIENKNVVALIIFTFIFVLMYKSTKRVDLSKEKMQIVKGEELPIQVLDALRISNNPTNTNPWGKNFLEKRSFQWICEGNCNYEYELDIDESSGGFFGRAPTILYVNGFEIILNLSLIHI